MTLQRNEKPLQAHLGELPTRGWVFLSVVSAALAACGVREGPFDEPAGLKNQSLLSCQVTGALSAGEVNTCAIINGGARCWGNNLTGIASTRCAGSGPGEFSAAPVNVPGLSSGVTAVSASAGFACFVVDGAAKCVGSNAKGRLGDGTTTTRATPVTVKGLDRGVTAISAGSRFACAVVNGGAKCWGDNFYGMLGNDSTADSWVPVDVQGLESGVTAIAAGSNHTCAIQNGAVKCWGFNNYGALGNHRTSDSHVPVQVEGLTAGATAVHVATWFSCAIVNGGARCWGLNTQGQLGNNSTVLSTVPVAVQGLESGVTQISNTPGYIPFSGVHTCAVVNGAAMCWGSNASGQLGNNSTTYSAVPVPVVGLGAGVTSIAAGTSHSCAVVSGAIKCWGANCLASLGTNDVSLDGASRVPVAASAPVDEACPSSPNSASACVTGVCVLTCGAGHADCDGNTLNGCELPVATDNANCGACGNACSSAETCLANSCVAPAAPQLQVIRLPSGFVRISGHGTPGVAYRVEASDDLTTWTVLTTVTVDESGDFSHLDADAPNHAARFYRAQWSR